MSTYDFKHSLKNWQLKWKDSIGLYNTTVSIPLFDVENKSSTSHRNLSKMHKKLLICNLISASYLA